MSERTVSSSPRSCSGEENAGVPKSVPELVRFDSVRTEAEMDSPKSPILVVPSESMKQFVGLMSRCSTPACWAASSPAMIWSIMSTASVAGRGPDASTQSRSVPPPTSSMAITGVPAISSVPKT